MNSNYVPRGYLSTCVPEGYLPFGILWELVPDIIYLEAQLIISRLFSGLITTVVPGVVVTHLDVSGNVSINTVIDNDVGV